MSGRSSCEKMKNADNGLFGAFGSLPAFFDVPEAPRGIVLRYWTNEHNLEKQMETVRNGVRLPRRCSFESTECEDVEEKNDSNVNVRFSLSHSRYKD